MRASLNEKTRFGLKRVLKMLRAEILRLPVLWAAPPRCHLQVQCVNMAGSHGTGFLFKFTMPFINAIVHLMSTLFFMLQGKNHF